MKKRTHLFSPYPYKQYRVEETDGSTGIGKYGIKGTSSCHPPTHPFPTPIPTACSSSTFQHLPTDHSSIHPPTHPPTHPGMVSANDYKKIFQESQKEHKKQANFPGFR